MSKVSQELRKEMFTRIDSFLAISRIFANLVFEFSEAKQKKDNAALSHFETIDIYFERGLVMAECIFNKVGPDELNTELYIFYSAKWNDLKYAEKLVNITINGLKNNNKVCEKIIRRAGKVYADFYDSRDQDEMRKIAADGLSKLYKDKSLKWD